MLDTINRNAGSALSAANRYFSDKASKPGATVVQASAVAVHTEDAVTVSLSKEAVSASAADTSAQPSPATAAANADAQRAQQALGAIIDAKGQAASQYKGFLRQKLEGYKKQLQLLRLLGTDPREIAKGAVRVARGVAGAARDYAAATLDEKKAGLGGSTSDFESESQAQDDLAALKTKAAAAPLDSAAGDTPPGAPTDPDERFFYDAFRIMGLAKKTIVQAQHVDTKMSGGKHGKEFKKMLQREGELEDAVSKSYLAMKTGGDLKDVDALLNSNTSQSLGSGM